jgi:hypothetical protein
LTTLEIQAQDIKPPVDSETAIKKGTVGNEDKTKGDELSECARHFEYISTMASFDDSFFKRSIRKDLMKDRQVTWTAFKTLPPQLV